MTTYCNSCRASLLACRSHNSTAQAWMKCVAYTYRNVAVRNRDECARVQHFCAKPRESGRFRVGKLRQETSIHHQSWISRQHTVYVGIDSDLGTIEGRTNDGRGIVRAVTA